MIIYANDIIIIPTEPYLTDIMDIYYKEHNIFSLNLNFVKVHWHRHFSKFMGDMSRRTVDDFHKLLVISHCIGLASKVLLNDAIDQWY